MASDLDDSTKRWRRHAVSGLLIITMVVAAVIWRPDLALRVAMGVTAHDVCIGTFMTGRDPDIAFRESVAPRPGLKLLARFITIEVNKEKRLVQAGIGGVKRRAAFTPGRGCLVLLGGASPHKEMRPEPASLPILLDIAGPEVVEPKSPQIAQALDQLFADTDIKHPRQVKAVVVLQDGKIIAERYADGYGVATPLNGWSASKSIMNALTGILVREGKFKVDQPAPVPLWRLPGEERGAITVDHLLRMTSGLDIDQDASGFDVSSRILYTQRDTASAAIHARLERKPGSEWHYSDPHTLILGRIVEDKVGGTPESLIRFARRELFEPLGMSDVTMETDAAGTPLASTYVVAPARSWARFGQLYLQDGMIGAIRILPEGWVAYSKRATLGTNYGAGFWTNDTSAPEAAGRIAAGMPKDAFFASGNLGQRVYIIPSRRMVIVRFGYTPDGDFGIVEDLRFMRAVLSASAVTPSPVKSKS